MWAKYILYNHLILNTLPPNWIIQNSQRQPHALNMMLILIKW